MKWREFIAGPGAAARLMVARAQQRPVIGYIGAGHANRVVAALLDIPERQFFASRRRSWYFSEPRSASAPS